MNLPADDVDNFFKSLKRSKENSFMTGVNKEEEIKYVQHNRDRFIAAINDLDKILNFLPKNAALLDIGTSPITFILKNRYPKLNITTIDISDNLAKRAKRAGINFQKVDLNNIERLPVNKKYDVIIFLEVLEHLKPKSHKPVLGWISTILNDGGTCLLQTPNNKSLKTIITNALGRKRMTKVTNHPDFPEEFAHLKEYNLSELIVAIKKNTSLEIKEAYHSMYFDTLGTSLAYRRPSTLIKNLLSIHLYLTKLIPPLRRGMQVIFIKKNGSPSPNYSVYKSWSNRVYPYYYENQLTPRDISIAKSGVQEIIRVSQNYLNKPLGKINILDVGSGRGEFSRELAKFFGKVVGIEPVKQVFDFCIKNTPKNIRNLIFENKTVEDFKSRQKFDLIIMLTVFEHMPTPKKSFDRIFKLLRDDGIIYLTAPNKYWITEQHYTLPFLSWLPLSLANIYLKIFRGIDSYEDSSYGKSYQGMKDFFNQYKCSYKFILPMDETGAFIGLGKKEPIYDLIKKSGIKLIKLDPFFWKFSKGFIIVIKKINEKLY